VTLASLQWGLRGFIARMFSDEGPMRGRSFGLRALTRRNTFESAHGVQRPAIVPPARRISYCPLRRRAVARTMGWMEPRAARTGIGEG